MRRKATKGNEKNHNVELRLQWGVQSQNGLHALKPPFGSSLSEPFHTSANHPPHIHEPRTTAHFSLISALHTHTLFLFALFTMPSIEFLRLMFDDISFLLRVNINSWSCFSWTFSVVSGLIVSMGRAVTVGGVVNQDRLQRPECSYKNRFVANRDRR